MLIKSKLKNIDFKALGQTLNESYQSSKLKINIDKILTESFGSFDNQKEISIYIAKEVLNTIDRGSIKSSINIEKFHHSQFNKVLIEIEIIDEENYTASGEFIGFCDVDYPIIKVYISKEELENVQYNILVSEIATIISHELMHGYIYINRWQKEKNLNDAPSYYDNAVKMIQECNHPVYRQFAYALYNTYYHEVQAFISNIGNEVMEIMEKEPKLTDFNIIIKQTKSYVAYEKNLRCIKQFENDFLLQQALIKVLSSYGINFNFSELEKKIKDIKKISQKALKKIITNGYYAFLTANEK